MVGTSSTEVIRCFSIASSTAVGGLPAGRSTTIEPCLIMVGRKTDAPAWLSGEQINWRISPGHSHSRERQDIHGGGRMAGRAHDRLAALPRGAAGITLGSSHDHLPEVEFWSGHCNSWRVRRPRRGVVEVFDRPRRRRAPAGASRRGSARLQRRVPRSPGSSRDRRSAPRMWASSTIRVGQVVDRIQVGCRATRQTSTKVRAPLDEQHFGPIARQKADPRAGLARPRAFSAWA